MGSNGSDEVVISGGDDAECSETTVEIKIKTLDSQTYTLRVNKRMPVPELKQQIATVTGVLSEQQRLICRGKVMKDDQLLSAYHVENGHTLHLVARQPLPPSSATTVGSESLLDHLATDPAVGTGQNRGNRVGHTVVLETFNLADQVDGGIPDLNRIVSAVLSSIGITGIGSGSGVDLREPGLVRHEGIPGASGMSDSTQLQRDLPTTRVQFDPLQGAFRLPTAASLGPLQPPVIPDSLTTMTQYLSHLRNEFSSNGSGQSNNAINAGMRGSQEREYNAASHSGAGQGGLPTPASLAEVILSTRQMLIEQAGGCLSQLARQLEDQTNVTTASLRSTIQTNAMRSGVLLQNLGALILELGRTTMTLRMGQMPSEAVVNAGPAVFISTSGPNPIMVQPFPFQPGVGFGATPMGNVNPGSGSIGGALGSGFFPRNIDIRIRTGPSMSTGNVNQDEQASAQPTPGQTGTGRGSDSASFIHQVAAGVTGGPSHTGESGVRVVPVRTVVAAVPAAVGLLARVQHISPGQLNNARGSQASDERLPGIPETNLPQIPESVVQQQNIGSNTGAPVRDGTLLTPNTRQHETPDFNTNYIGSVFGTENDAVSENQIRSISDQVLRDMFSGIEFQRLPRESATAQGGTENGAVSESQVRSISDQMLRDMFPDVEFQRLPRESATAQGGTAGGADTHEAAPRAGIDDGVFFSGLLHHIMPYISQNSSPEPSVVSAERADTSEHGIAQDSSTQTEENPVDVGTSHRRNDPPPTSPNSKRRKTE